MIATETRQTGHPGRLWDCWKCGAHGVRNVGTRGYCGIHLAELFAQFSNDPWACDGIAVTAGVARPEFGHGCTDVRCAACTATWVGVPGTRCPWCIRQRAVMLETQRAQLLHPPEPEASDATFEAWGERLKRAVVAGIITRDDAARVWRRAVRHAA
ncbi:MAG: hypothetical protein KGR47_04305 [Acidobacteria bacterium]|nr:hypothetical protein [Acidobacteriota bacterium]